MLHPLEGQFCPLMERQMAYLHNSRNLHLIAAAAKIADIDEAILSVMKPNSITTGDVAGVMFSGFDWETATIKEREQKLRDWLRCELQGA
jgi:hypothetical protein